MPHPIEEEYALSGMGECFIIISPSYVFTESGQTACKVGSKKLVAALQAVAQARAYQAVLDAMRRLVGNRICIPHLPKEYADTLAAKGRARPPASKWQFSLQDALEHALSACAKAGYKGALLAFSVRSRGSGTPDHMNMIYLDMPPDGQPMCYLFEPNGVEYSAANPDGVERLSAAWRCARGGGGSDVQVVGGDGVQTALGSRSRRTTSHTTVVTRRGYGVCGAVTWWMFAEWLTGSMASMPYVDFEARRIRKIKASDDFRQTCKGRLAGFITTLRSSIEACFRETDHKFILEGDLAELASSVRVRRQSRRRSSSSARSHRLTRHSCMIDIDVSMRLGKNNPKLCKEVQLRYVYQA